MLFTQITRRDLKLHHGVAMTINHSVNSSTDLFIVTVRWSCRVDTGIRDSAIERYYKLCEVVYNRRIASTLRELQTCIRASGVTSLRRRLYAVRELINHSWTVVYIRVYNACFDVRKPVLPTHHICVWFYRIKKYYTIPHCAVGVVMEKQSVFCKVI